MTHKTYKNELLSEHQQSGGSEKEIPPARNRQPSRQRWQHGDHAANQR